MKTFRIGGIHPAENKFSSGKKIQTADIPKLVAIPLAHYIGNPSEAIVKKGDLVQVGQMIGKANGFI
ncbi:MAG: electron transporter RnfC, partial [Paludibacter sp.]|nr:electron transporter RnfC [Paludibacter sp.]